MTIDKCAPASQIDFERKALSPRAKPHKAPAQVGQCGQADGAEPGSERADELASLKRGLCLGSISTGPSKGRQHTRPMLTPMKALQPATL